MDRNGEGRPRASGDACLTCALRTAAALGWSLELPDDRPTHAACVRRQGEKQLSATGADGPGQGVR
ncbi:MAG TPA: hypothetical protein VGR06_17440 [Actinophytocola sp.]|uniref:hypothetical protein n=1 Tax=Actinophytocola sp. TaxID=1872138 RepID=UPI002E058A16|nr:hypothetical protein [Actinophytocola sp.]